MAGVLLRYHAELLRTLPGEFAEALAQIHQENVLLALRQVQTLQVLHTALATAKVNWIVLKGIALSQLLYGDVATRGVGDLDVLVDIGDFDAAFDALCRAGHSPLESLPADARLRRARLERCGHEFKLRAPAGHAVELHWRTDDSPEFCLSQLAALWPDCAHQEVGGVPISTLPLSLYFPYAGRHAANSLCARWKWGYDLLELEDRGAENHQLDADFRAFAGNVQVTRTIMRALLRLEAANGELRPLPLKEMRRLSSPAGTRLPMAQELRDHARVWMYWIRLHRTWRSRLDFIVRMLLRPPADATPAAADRIERFPPMAPFIRLMQLFRRKRRAP